MIKTATPTRIRMTIDLEQQGRQVGDLQIKWSDNRRPLGVYPVPIICLSNAEGPTLLLTGGVHGDEFEGPAALMRLVQTLSLDEIKGRVLIIPALNAPALMSSSRVSPLDQVNMNRAFPGDMDAGPTHMLAQFIEDILISQCDAVIDLHSGGKASIFAPCVLTSVDNSTEVGHRNKALAGAFAAPYVWLAGAQNDNRSVNAAAGRHGVSMIASELGGGGGCDPAMTDFAERAIRRCLHHLGIISQSIAEESSDSQWVEFNAPEQNYLAPSAGLFDRNFNIGDKVNAGDPAGFIHFIEEPERNSVPLYFPCSGVIFAHNNRGLIERGETLAMIAQSAHILEK
ncbi:MAG: putative deacylase [Gammaproteobacteria bacterium]|jgi:predicted deacylase